MSRSSRNATKKLVRRVLKSTGQSHRGIGGTVRRQVLTQTGRQFLQSAELELDRRSKLLGLRGCWAFLDEQGTTASKLGVLAELRQMVVSAAQKFSGLSVKTVATGSN